MGMLGGSGGMDSMFGAGGGGMDGGGDEMEQMMKYIHPLSLVLVVITPTHTPYHLYLLL